MPARIIKPEACTSPRLAALSAGAERLWWRLLTQCDDHGVFDADPRVVRGQCLSIVACDDDDVQLWIDELTGQGMIGCCAVDDQRWGIVIRADRYFRRRSHPRRVDVYDTLCQQVLTNDSGCQQMPADDSGCQQPLSNVSELKTTILRARAFLGPEPLVSPNGLPLSTTKRARRVSQYPDILDILETKAPGKSTVSSQNSKVNARIIEDNGHPTPLEPNLHRGNPDIIRENQTPEAAGSTVDTEIIGDSVNNARANARIIEDSQKLVLETSSAADKTTSAADKRSSRAGDILDVFAHYRVRHPRAHRQPKSTSKEWRLIEARLEEGSTVEDLRLAIDGCHASPFHMGANEDGRKYTSLALIVRDGSKVQAFSEMWEQRDQPILTKSIKTGMMASARWANMKRKELENDSS